MLETLAIHTAMVICFFMSLWFQAAKVTGPLLFRVPIKILSILGVVAPIIFYLMYFNVIARM